MWQWLVTMITGRPAGLGAISFGVSTPVLLVVVILFGLGLIGLVLRFVW